MMGMTCGFEDVDSSSQKERMDEVSRACVSGGSERTREVENVAKCATRSFRNCCSGELSAG